MPRNIIQGKLYAGDGVRIIKYKSKILEVFDFHLSAGLGDYKGITLEYFMKKDRSEMLRMKRSHLASLVREIGCGNSDNLVGRIVLAYCSRNGCGDYNVVGFEPFE